MFIVKTVISPRDLEKASLKRRIQRIKAFKLIYRLKNKSFGDYILWNFYVSGKNIKI